MSASLRVLHIGKFYPPFRGGMEVFLADLIHTQRAQGIDAAALVHGDPEPDDPHWLVRVPVQFSVLYAPIALGFRAALARVIRQFKPDILHLHLPNNSALWVLTLPQARAIPWVVHWHSDVVLSNIKWSVAAAYAMYRPFEQALLDGAERIIATSQPYVDASEPLRRWHSKCAVVPLGLRTDLLPPIPPLADIEGERHADPAPGHWSPKASLRLLSIGRLTYYKGFETLIEAVQQLPGVELLIVGEGELHAALQSRIAAGTARRATTGVLPPRLLGDISEPEKHALLAGCDLFCLASRERTEAFGVVLLEAMHHARACIVTDLPGSGMPWVVSQSRTGLCVPIEDVQAWRSAITRLQHDQVLRRKLGGAGPQALKRIFDIAACAHAVANQYRCVTPTARNGPVSRFPLAVVTTHNEASSIGALVRQLKAQGLPDVLVIDHRSTDGTCHQARNAGAIVLSPLLSQSRWGAIQTGMRYALTRGYNGVVSLTANQNFDGGSIELLLQQCAHADVTLASPPPEPESQGIRAAWFRTLSGLPVRAPDSQLRHYSWHAMPILTAREATLLDHADLGVLLLARRAGLSIAEITIAAAVHPPAPEKPKMTRWTDATQYFAATTLMCLAHWVKPQETQ